ncbi:TIM barrel protein [Kiritimatiellota bacterium B12222]|nr:TIM barrel protein [Kiritimatiellota bacterium B12222]
MSSIKQSFSWWCYADRAVAPQDLLHAAAKIGYAAVEMIEPELWPMAHEAGLEIATISGHHGIDEGLNRPENSERIEQELRKNIDIAVKYRIPALICFSGKREGISDAEGLENCSETLKRIMPYAEQAGITLIMELLNSKVNHPDYQCDTSAWGIQLCQKVDSPHFRLLYDIYHMQIMEGDIIRTIGESHPYFAHYHTAGNPGRGPLSEEQELNYPAIFKAIAQSGYTGYIGHEFIPEGNPIQELERAYHLCEDALK